MNICTTVPTIGLQVYIEGFIYVKCRRKILFCFYLDLILTLF